jgi:regulator of protease activity HflC (stomatin/prohibitin superfamily)
MKRYLVIPVIILILFGLFLSTGTISAGQEGVRTRLGAVTGTVPPGLYFQTPFIESTIPMDVQVQKEEANASAASSDLQIVNAKVAVNYNPKASAVADIYARLGNDYATRVIDPAIQEVVKAVTAKYTAEELITKRADVTAQIQSQLAERLQPYNIQITSVSITNFDFSKEFNTAIEAKVAAVQNALAEQNNLQASQFKAQAIKVTAEAANNDNYIHLQELDVERAAISKWNGVLPQQQVPGSAVPFINLNTKS